MTKSRSPRPLSLKLLVIFFYFLDNIVWLTNDALPLSVQQRLLPWVGIESGTDWFLLYFAGLVITGPLALLIRLASYLVPLWIGLGLWRLRPSVRRFAIVWQGFWLFEAILNYFSPIVKNWGIQASLRGGLSLESAQWLVSTSLLSDIGINALSVLFMGFVLFKCRAAFK